MDSGWAFWIFVGAIIVASIWASSRKQAERHETLRRIVEKTGTIDEAQMRELFKEEPKDEWKPGGGYRVARVTGTIVMFIGAGIAMVSLIAAGIGKALGETRMFEDMTGWIVAPALSVGVAILGLGIFFSSRFCEPPAR